MATTTWVGHQSPTRENAGVLYLLVALLGGTIAFLVRSGVRVAGDAVTTADNFRATAPA